jgi:hypothetical protein
MKKAFYSTPRQSFWRDLAAVAQERQGLVPAYWITTNANRASVQERFPGCLCHDSIDLGRGLDPDEKPLDRSTSIGEDVLAALARDEHIALEMMDRMDLDGSFSLRARKRLYLAQLGFFLSVFRRLRPDVLFFAVPPHLPGEYVMYAVARHLEVPIRILRPTALAEHSLVTEDLDTLPDGLRQAAAANADAGAGPTSAAVAQEIDAILKGERPWYFVRNSKVNERQELFRAKAAEALDASGGRTPPINLDPSQDGFIGIRNPQPRHAAVLPRAYAVPGRTLADGKLSVGEFQCYLRWSLFDKIRLERAYAAHVSTDPDLTGPYVFLPLHYQPERTTSPDGGRFSNQVLLAAMVANALPKGWRLLIKEHPNQFSFKNTGNQSRDVWVYDDLAALPNTTLLPLDMPSKPVVQAASAIATVTGFAGWEALCRGKPVLVFGTAWYQDCVGAFRVRTGAEMEDAFRAILDARVAPSAEASARIVRGYARAIEDFAVQHLCLAPDDRIAKLFGDNVPGDGDLVDRMVTRAFAGL